LAILEKEPDTKDPPILQLTWWIADKMDAILFKYTCTRQIEVQNELKREIDDTGQLMTVSKEAADNTTTTPDPPTPTATPALVFNQDEN